jgi:APA family basic amino acid/polyamine antiporter
MPEQQPQQLKRELGWFGATVLGLGSVIGAGIFVSLGLAAGISGSAVIVALVFAVVLQSFNSLNLAQLTISHPISGGVYEYGYRYLTPWLGFTGGWMFLIGKIAVAATAALGFSGYLVNMLGWGHARVLTAIAELAVVGLTGVVLGGVRSSKVTTLVVFSITLASLIFLIGAGIVTWPSDGWSHLAFTVNSPRTWFTEQLQSVALLFVAYNGAARVSMLGEEVTHPRQTIPRAIITTILMTMGLYLAIAIVSIGALGAEAFSQAARLQAAPLEAVAESFGIPGAAFILTLGASTAMLTIVLNTILGLSRLLLAMGRRGDMPRFLAQLNVSGTTPPWAVLGVGVAIALLTLIGSVKVTWALGTFGALYRCVVVSLAALRLDPSDRLYSQGLSWAALVACLLLMFCLDWQIWLVGLGLIGLGLVWHLAAQNLKWFSPAKSEYSLKG